MRSIAMYSETFITAKTSAIAATGRHCLAVKVQNRGRTMASRKQLATHWRMATTPAGPRAGNAWEAIAAPAWEENADPVIRAMPVAHWPGGAASAAASARSAAAPSPAAVPAPAVPAPAAMPTGPSLTSPDRSAKCIKRRSYTLWLWILSCATFAAW
jgi:hypothetical protein